MTKVQRERRRILRKTLYAALRKFVHARLTAAGADYDSKEYRFADWQESHFYGRAAGMIELARQLGLIGFSDQLGNRIERVYKASSARSEKVREAKYERIRQSQETAS